MKSKKFMQIYEDFQTKIGHSNISGVVGSAWNLLEEVQHMCMTQELWEDQFNTHIICII